MPAQSQTRYLTVANDHVADALETALKVYTIAQIHAHHAYSARIVHSGMRNEGLSWWDETNALIDLDKRLKFDGLTVEAGTHFILIYTQGNRNYKPATQEPTQ